MRLAVIIIMALLSFSDDDASAATQLSPKQLTLNYQIFVGGFETGRVELTVSRNNSEYIMTSQVRSMGLIDALIGFRSKARTNGHVRQDAVWPGAHSADNLWMGDKRHVRINYGAEGPKQVQVAPLPEDDDREPVPPALRLGTLDALSAALAMSRLASEDESSRCSGSLPVFDGRRRYNIRSRGIGPDVLKGRVFNGKAYKCEVELERIAGHSESPWLPRQENEGGDIWFAKLSRDWPAIPVRFETDIGMGSVVIHITHAAGTGLKLGRPLEGN